MPKAISLLARTAFDGAIPVPLLKSFERHLKAQNASPHTLTHYLGSTRYFLAFCEDENMPGLAQVRREHIERWLEHLYGGGYATASVAHYFKGLHQFYRWLLEEGEIRQDPMARIKQPVVEETRKDVVTDKVLARTLARLEKERRWRDCVLVALCYDTGIRAGELADCLMEHVDLDKGLIVLPRTKNKKMRTLPLTPKAVRYIDRYLRKPRSQPAYLINGHRGKMTANGIYQAIRHVFEEMGVEARIGPHDLRHTSASHIRRDLSDDQMKVLYGWNSDEMVQRYTSQVREQDAIAAHRKASPLERLQIKGGANA